MAALLLMVRSTGHQRLIAAFSFSPAPSANAAGARLTRYVGARRRDRADFLLREKVRAPHILIAGGTGLAQIGQLSTGISIMTFQPRIPNSANSPCIARS